MARLSSNQIEVGNTGDNHSVLTETPDYFNEDFSLLSLQNPKTALQVETQALSCYGVLPPLTISGMETANFSTNTASENSLSSENDEVSASEEDAESSSETSSGDNEFPTEAEVEGLEMLKYRFNSIDSNANGHVTAKEIGAYLSENSISMDAYEIDVFEKIGRNVRHLEEHSNDEFGDENSGITRQDILIAQERKVAIQFAEANFDKLDFNKDGHVTGKELDQHMKDNSALNNIPIYVDAMAMLKKSVSHLEERNNDEFGDENSGFTKKDLYVGMEQIADSNFLLDWANER